MSDSNKIFDDFPTVECDNCESYWINQCDGVIKGSERLCNSFVAVRRESIPLKLKRLEKAFKWLLACVVILGVVSIGTLVLTLLLIFGIL